MVRSEIISKLSKRIHHKLRRKDLEKIFQIVLDTIIQGIENDKSTELRDFGRFSVKELKDKIAINPRTGDKFQSSKKKSISFKMSADLRKRVNEYRVKN
tara:strand:- start:1740 stop:2036 length:297 start_codon:yes stop_codon:yes gene_type:complete